MSGNDDLFNEFFEGEKKEEKPEETPKPESKYHGEDCESCDKFGPQAGCYENDHAGCTGYVHTPDSSDEVDLGLEAEKEAEIKPEPAPAPTPEKKPEASPDFPFSFDETTETKTETPTKETTEEKPITDIESVTPVQVTEPSGDFKVEEATDEGAVGIMDYGDKGSGKTTFALSYPGKIAVVAYDRQALPIKSSMYNNDNRITVYDAIRYYDKASAQRLLETSDTTFRYTMAILDELEKNRPDVIVIDGSEIMQKICEMTMRYRNNLQPFQGIANRNLWKERNMYVDQVFLRSLAIAKKAVICTAYIAKDEIIKEGETVALEDVPKWVGTIMTDTRIVIRIKPEKTETGLVFKADIQSSKDSRFKTGLEVDVTGTKGIEKIWEASRNKTED